MTMETDAVSKHFEDLTVLQNVTLTFPNASITAIVGPNGAGKTTLLNVMAGFLKPDNGFVYLIEDASALGRQEENHQLKRTNLSTMDPHDRALHGLGVLFQDIRVFKTLSALENVAVARKSQIGEKLCNCFLRPRRVKAEESQVLEDSLSFLDLVGMGSRANVAALDFSYGEQKLIAFARLLAGNSKVMLLDEPTAGVNPERIELPMGSIRDAAHQDGRTAVIVEHNLDVVRQFADWACLLVSGRIEDCGTPELLLRRSRTVFGECSATGQG